MSVLAVQQTLIPVELPLAGLFQCDVDSVNRLLVRWDHNLGPCERLFEQQGWIFCVYGEPVACAVSASSCSSTAAGRPRGELVELARLCASERWANRVMLRLWREVAAHQWESWPVRAAIAYSQNYRHEGRLYRHDGWTKVTDRAGSNGGGNWSAKRDADHPAKGSKTLWIWDYEELR